MALALWFSLVVALRHRLSFESASAGAGGAHAVGVGVVVLGLLGFVVVF